MNHVNKNCPINETIVFTPSISFFASTGFLHKIICSKPQKTQMI